jgi:glycosyltransferase involved in cell wall biosynthesis
MSEPLVSICIPSFNAAGFIRESILSVFDQDYKNIELIIIDDASSDETASIVAELISDAHIPVVFDVNSSNLGLAGNWNKTLELASGKYIKVLPSDDKISVNCISKSVEAMESHGEAVIAFSPRVVIDRESVEKLQIDFFSEGIVSAKKLIYSSMLFGTNLIGEPGAVLFKSEVVRKIGGFDGSLPYVIDLDYWVRLLQYGSGYKLLGSKAYFRISDNLSVSLGPARFEDFSQFLKKITNKYNYPKSLMYFGIAVAFVNDNIRRWVHRKIT